MRNYLHQTNELAFFNEETRKCRSFSMFTVRRSYGLSDRNPVCPSVCQSHAFFATKRKNILILYESAITLVF